MILIYWRDSMKNQPLIEQAMSILKEHGYKYTKKREAIITYLVKRNRYLPAKESMISCLKNTRV